jgi:hypothetical protein
VEGCVVAWLEVMCTYLLGGTEQNVTKLNSEQIVSGFAHLSLFVWSSIYNIRWGLKITKLLIMELPLSCGSRQLGRPPLTSDVRFQAQITHFHPPSYQFITPDSRVWPNLFSPLVTICTASITFNNSTFCPRSIFMCFVWISEETAIISQYDINWLVCITDRVCLLRGTDRTTVITLSVVLNGPSRRIHSEQYGIHLLIIVSAILSALVLNTRVS